MAYIHSTASQPMVYPIYAEGRQNQARVIKTIRIEGYANVANPVTLVTPNGAVTEVSDEDLALLKRDPAFQRHVKAGFMKVYDSPALNTEGMEKADGCAQLQDAAYAAGTDPRVAGSGDCQASCGLKDRIKGKPGVRFVSEGF